MKKYLAIRLERCSKTRSISKPARRHVVSISGRYLVEASAVDFCRQEYHLYDRLRTKKVELTRMKDCYQVPLLSSTPSFFTSLGFEEKTRKRESCLAVHREDEKTRVAENWTLYGADRCGCGSRATEKTLHHAGRFDTRCAISIACALLYTKSYISIQGFGSQELEMLPGQVFLPGPKHHSRCVKLNDCLRSTSGLQVHLEQKCSRTGNRKCGKKKT